MSARVVVLDDDPTGTQCASGVLVAVDPDPAALTGLDGRALYVLTNTRAVDARSAARIVRGVRSAFEARAGETVMVLRGDSTLRGHVAVEMEALGLDRGVGLIVPAYPAAGRLTLGGVHYLESPAGRLNAADTEFARDPVFGFQSRTLTGWCREVGLRGPVVLVGLDELKSSGPASVRDALLAAPPGAVVAPDAADDDDITAIARGFSAARAAGRHVVVRCAAPLAAAIAGTPGRMLAPAHAPASRMLVVCGSHTAAATRQLERLAGTRRPVRILAAAGLMGPDTTDELAEGARADLADSGLAIIATERIRRDEHARSITRRG
ncbi:MAG: four-carbon acid sugar kinase family protein [Streptosporangiaceae bacterium]